jgi:pyruvate/2-oxoglutarate/acetoin dehydrogenase E1 component
MAYFDELTRAMSMLAGKPDTLFVGQAVGVSGTFMFNTLAGVPPERRLEFPVAESFQMQFSLGLALAGTVPVCIFPRQNFLALAVGDLVNTVDKVPAISGGKLRPKVIIRTAVGPDQPVHPGHQHIGDFTEAFQRMFSHIKVRRLDEPEDVFPAYVEAYATDGVSLLIEVGNHYNAK